MRWLKHGIVWKPDGSLSWARSHATCPTPIVLRDGTLRVYVQCRDFNNVGRVGYVDLNPNDPREVIGFSDKPVLDIGEPGCFDDNGVFQTSVINAENNNLFMYYVGFELCHHIRYRLFTGLAVSTDGGFTFNRHLKVPILDRVPQEEFFRCGPFVSKNQFGYQMWYVSGSEWTIIDGKKMPIYDLKTINSQDGINWIGQGRSVLKLDKSVEHGFGRPFIIKSSSVWKMFYSIRKIHPPAYRLGYAESIDGGETWNRMDELLNLNVSDSGWDHESVEYSSLINTGGKTWMLYNGNDFGGSGFGIAELLES